MKDKSNSSRSAAVQDALVRGVIGLTRLLPYRARVAFFGGLFAWVVAPLAGWRTRIADNLRHVLPDLPPDEVRRLQRAVPRNVGRTAIELYSGQEFRDRPEDIPLSGPGLEAFLTARKVGRPVILVASHFGNHVVPRDAIVASGETLAGLYRPMRNTFFNEHYVPAMESPQGPVFPSDRRGILKLIRHLTGGGMIIILTDVYAIDGAPLAFFGQPAKTAVAAAAWAIKFDALLIPIYGVRRADGFHFDVVLDDPVPHSDPETMMQAANDSLERMVRQHMDQWFWIHRRWDVKYSG